MPSSPACDFVLSAPRRGAQTRSAAWWDLEPALAQGPRRELGARGDIEPLEQPPKMGLDRLRPDPEPRRDLVIRATVDDEADDVELALAEPNMRRGRRRPDRKGEPTSGSPPDRVEQLGDRGGLEHEPRCPESKRGLRVLRIVVRRQDDHG